MSCSFAFFICLCVLTAVAAAKNVLYSIKTTDWASLRLVFLFVCMVMRQLFTIVFTFIHTS